MGATTAMDDKTEPDERAKALDCLSELMNRLHRIGHELAGHCPGEFDFRPCYSSQLAGKPGRR